MLRIRTWIFIPLVILLLIFPIGIYVIFDVTSKDYVQQIAEKDLKMTLDIVLPIAEEVLYEDSENDGLSEEELLMEQSKQAREFFIRVRDAFKQRSSGAQLIVTGRDGEIAYPDAKSVSEEVRRVYEYFTEQLEISPELIPLEETTSVIIDEKEYIMYSMKIEVVKRNRYLIAFSQLSDTTELLAATRRLILVITTVLAAFVIALAWIMSAAISKPIEKLCKHTRQVSRRNLTYIENTNRIYEISALTGEMNDMSMRLKQYEDDQREFYQNVAHELRTPLMSIRGYAEGIGYGAFSDNKEAAGIIISQSMRLSDMAGELLLLSELENNGLNIDIQKINVIDYLQEQIKLTEGVAITKDIKINMVSASIRPDTRIEADGELLSKAITNILANCIRYARKQVTVSVEYSDEFMAILISDDGDGISPENIEHIFKRFYKGRNGNTGLGLAIAKAVLENMNGSIEAYNSKTGGAVFKILIPAVT